MPGRHARAALAAVRVTGVEWKDVACAGRPESAGNGVAPKRGCSGQAFGLVLGARCEHGIRYLDAAARAQPHVVLLTVIAALRPRLNVPPRDRAGRSGPARTGRRCHGPWPRSAVRPRIAPVTQVATLPVSLRRRWRRRGTLASPAQSVPSFRETALRRAGRVPELGTTGTVNCQQVFLRPPPGNGKPGPKPVPRVVVKEGLTMPS
jgi:hypothetical protein